MSRPIIENSSGIDFAEYPSVIGDKLGLEIAKEQEWYVKELIEDFNWLRKEHSPNWSILRDIIKDETWSNVLTQMDGSPVEVGHILKMVGIE
jgi:tubulin-specific chaperone C